MLFIYPQVVHASECFFFLTNSSPTFSTRPPTRRRWGTQVETVSSAPPLRSPCTWRWSWAATDVPVPSRRPRLCSRSLRRSGRPSRASESPCSWPAWGLGEDVTGNHECMSFFKRRPAPWPSLRSLFSSVSKNSEGLMTRPRVALLLLFNVARHSHYSVIDCSLACILRSH